MFGFRQRRQDGVLRCHICGQERDRVPRGLFYGFPRCCGQIMTVVLPAQLERERRQAEDLERHEGVTESGLFHVG